MGGEKRKSEDDPRYAKVAAFINTPLVTRLEELISSDMNLEEIALLFMRLSERNHVQLRDLKKAKTLGLSSFSKATWHDMLKNGNPFDLPADFWDVERRDVAPCYLPCSIHTTTLVQAWYALEVYGDPRKQIIEAHKLRAFEPILVSILNLFHGRFMDRPEGLLPGNDYSLGGRVEHEVFFRNAQMVLVFEMKSYTIEECNIAQLFQELVAAAEYNKDIPELANARVHGILSNVTNFFFYSYDPCKRKFSKDGEVLVNTEYRILFLRSATLVTERVFGLMLDSLIDVLSNIAKFSERRGKEGDNRPIGSGELTLAKKDEMSLCSPSVHNDAQLHAQSPSASSGGLVSHLPSGRGRQSTSKWDIAVMHAKNARQDFSKVPSTVEELNENGEMGMKHLQSCLQMVPRATGNLDAPFDVLDMATPQEIFKKIEVAVLEEQKVRIGMPAAEKAEAKARAEARAEAEARAAAEARAEAMAEAKAKAEKAMAEAKAKAEKAMAEAMAKAEKAMAEEADKARAIREAFACLDPTLLNAEQRALLGLNQPGV